MNRACIYFFYDKDGIVDKYVEVMLQEVLENANHLLVVVNGNLLPEGRKILQKYTEDLIVRENVGLDVWAYKTALEYWGWERVDSFDELIMMNSTIMGPVFPFKEMFSKMEQQELDFWGITTFNKIDGDPFGMNPYGYIPKHLQSHFIAVRNKMLRSPEYHSHWDNMRPINSYEESISFHESIFTKKFADMGFQWTAYADSPQLEKFSQHPILMCPIRLFNEFRCPIFKRRSFFHSYSDVMQFTGGEPAITLYNYLKNQSTYDLNLIWDNILRTCNMWDIKYNLQLNYILSDKNVTENRMNEHLKIGLVMHIYYEDLVETQCFRYVKSMPESADFFITTPSQKVAQKVQEVFRELPNNFTVELIPNRGRDVSSLLVASKEFVNNYDYICFAHDKKVPQLDWGSQGEAFAYSCFENLLPTENFVKNVISTFESEPRLGLLCPPPPDCGPYYLINSNYNWDMVNYRTTRKLARAIGITVPIDMGKPPVAPLGTMFWFRREAFQSLLNRNWSYEDFLEEPVEKTDGTILHALERIYGLTAQNSGYYVGWLFSDHYAKIRISNLDFDLFTLNSAAISITGLQDQPSISTTLYDVSRSGKKIIKKAIKGKIKSFSKTILPPFIYNFFKNIWLAVRYPNATNISSKMTDEEFRKKLNEISEEDLKNSGLQNVLKNS